MIKASRFLCWVNGGNKIKIVLNFMNDEKLNEKKTCMSSKPPVKPPFEPTKLN